MKSRRYFRLLFVILICLLCRNISAAQTGKFYSTEDGLSSTLINSIYQDSRGFIWIATEYGLNRFDGVKFNTYNNIQNDSTSLLNNYVRTIFESSTGKLFIGTISGLMRYDPESNAFRNINLLYGQRIVYTHVTGIAENDNGDLWIVTSGMGLFVMKRGDSAACFRPEISRSLSSNYLNSCLCDSNQNIWIGSENDGLNRYNSETGEITIFRAPSAISGDNISAIAEDRSGNILVSTLTKGLNKYDPAADKFTRVPYTNNTPLLIFSLLVNKDNELILGTDGQGLKIYNRQRNVVEDLDVVSVPFDFGKSKIHSMFQDREHNIWFGIFQKGIVYMPKTRNKFDYYGYKSHDYNIIGSNCVTSIYKDRSGRLWVGTDNDGIYGIDDGRRTAHFFRTGSPLSAPNIILCIFEDSDNNLWIGSYTNGLAVIDRKTGICRYIDRLSNEKIYSIIEDRNKNLLIGAFGSGLFILDVKTKELKQYQSSKQEPNDLKLDELGNDWITYLLCDSEGLVWIGHYKGLSCFNPTKKSFINYLGQNTLLPGTIVNTICESSDGAIWSGTSTGLYRFDKKTTRITRYAVEDGLANDMICGIIEDSERNLWVSTYKGISKYNTAENRFSNYYTGDELNGYEFTRGAAFKDATGRIYFGGTSGVTSFYPQDITENTREIKLMLTEFYLSNKPVKRGDKSGRHEIVSSSVMDAEEFKLAYYDNTFTLEFSTLDFVNPEHISYRYMIEGLNSKWTNTQSGINRITYNNLPPDKYKFLVQACDNNNCSQIKTITIIITAPWYKNWWAYLIYSLLVLLLIYGIINFVRSRIRYRQEIMRKEHAEEINEAKLQFFINISHEIRTPMTLIISPLEKLLSEKRDPAAQTVYLMMHRNAQRILRLINQLMDIRKLDKGLMRIKCRETDIVGFIDDFMHTFEYMAGKKNITFTFEHSFDKLKVWIDLNNFDKVLLNILSNAFKFTPDNGSITVKLTTGRGDDRVPGQDYFEIRIMDSGIGVDADKIEKIFDRFYQIDQHNYFGTGIGLHLSRQLVELHHGVIYSENRRGGEPGTEFVIRLPLGNDHLCPDELENPEEAARQPEYQHVTADSDIIDEDSPETKKTKKERAKTGYKILLVEDEEDIRRYVSDQLSHLYRIDEARDGSEAYQKIVRNGYDLVISDVMMPEMDGLTLTRKIKQNINTNHIPVILLTAKSEDHHRIEGLETGVDAYLGKPFSVEILIETINNLLSNRAKLKTKFSGKQEYDDKIDAIELRSSDELLMEKILKIINANMLNPKLNVEMLASNVGISRVHMHRKLKELTNQSARDFIRGIRLKQAAALLADKKLTVSEIAYATGFSNMSHFSSSFKDFYGVSPKEYRSDPDDSE